MDDIKNIIEQTLIPHRYFELAVNRIKQYYSEVHYAREPICFALLGESRTGKSRVLEEALAAYKRSRNDEGAIVPILRVGAPSKPTPKALSEKMLHSLGDPNWKRTSSESHKTERLKTLLRACGVRMIIVNEFQHFYDQGSQKVMHHVADWLKALIEELSDDGWTMALVVAGLPNSMAVIRQNEQLAGRFLAPLFMPRFVWTDDVLRGEFIAILGAFQESLGQHFDTPKMDDEEVAFLFYCATGGLIGYLTKILSRCVSDTLLRDSREITLESLAAAHETAIWNTVHAAGKPSPFRRPGAYRQTDEIVLKTAGEIGCGAEPEPVLKHYGRARKRDLNSILRTT